MSRGAVKGSLPAFGAHGNTRACRTVCGKSQENRMVGAHHVSVNGQSAFAGRLGGVEDGMVLLEEGRKTHRVPVAQIKRGRLEVEF